MNQERLNNLKKNLWETADELRANSGLKASAYSIPVLGLIFLKFADAKYEQHEDEIMKEYEALKGGRREKKIEEIAIEKCGFYLPEQSRFSYLLNLNEEEDIANKIKGAMEGIEEYSPEFVGVLPKDNYHNLNAEDNNKILNRLLRNFNDIPTDSQNDIFGEVYEYFLGNFALAEGQGGGEFYTPRTVVRYMVEVLQPMEGKILDPACGSGGMFVQTAHYAQEHKVKNGGTPLNLRAYGVERTGETVKLAKMNLFLNNIRGEITEANSYYADPYDSFSNFDYVLANPPFNVDNVELDLVKDQKRFNTYGVPQTKGKKPKVPNGNYLWINQFATALNETGKASLVMANSASDAGHSEKEIRKALIEDGIVSQMVALPSNMFSTVTLPATLWFFDKQKKKKDEILFIDARNIFTQVDRALREFSDEQIKNLAIINRLYEEDSESFDSLIKEYEISRDNADSEEDKKYFQKQIDWLLERFPDGKYQDVIGLCKVAKLDGEDGIIDQDYSLNPGRYVGIVIEDDGMTAEQFQGNLSSLNEEFKQLNEEAKELEAQIEKNLDSLVIEYE
ncbi:type I restriction-modification system subunit M [Staphylococcus saprophyticus]|uniref:type I restriction-modification system subunit M n=1 Tax=Staphylococcus saprophyticus TaxID=29385 RepID=UPI0016433E7F|nr:class I SAM-dependent DNA methyltransferase [Staphylococcus saprophyticus]MBC2919676.1 SAM-dependent DNA methyltransferase [Staphylococcus saprophyticus]MBC2956963.1 SAM-dependent DNA methyltransferase [Staphylococcus saprophyticus]MBC3008915.1 SAM-dependent DNA methyltransferase [Staphylococcus saprophyticus]MBC3021994.1 SAM-dependent DNA methyltransferase [Staphylococcus saprophyticus]MBC3029947.1 SAM-dependent DNA methyltransferase [Staphylococcus saprophyticus]